MTLDEAREILRQRRDYLGHRIEGKKQMGWEYQYDEREREALTRMLDRTERWRNHE